jgi:hypothetical protein
LILYITVSFGWALLLLSALLGILKLAALKSVKSRYAKDWEFLSEKVFTSQFNEGGSFAVAGFYLEQKSFQVMYDDSFSEFNARFGNIYRVSLRAFKFFILLATLWILGLITYVELRG